MGVDIAKAQAMWATGERLERELGESHVGQIALTLPAMGAFAETASGAPPHLDM